MSLISILSPWAYSLYHFLFSGRVTQWIYKQTDNNLKLFLKQFHNKTKKYFKLFLKEKNFLYFVSIGRFNFYLHHLNPLGCTIKYKLTFNPTDIEI